MILDTDAEPKTYSDAVLPVEFAPLPGLADSGYSGSAICDCH